MKYVSAKVLDYHLYCVIDIYQV